MLRFHELPEAKQILHFGPGMPNEDVDFRVFSTHPGLLESYDVLVFADSRGSVSSEPETPCWTELLIDHLNKRGMTALCVTRPKVLTIAFSLVNFLRSNPLGLRSLVTNIGFVDLTPKKREYMDDIAVQNPFPIGSSRLKARELAPYRLSSGEVTSLFTFDYGALYKRLAQELEARFEYAMLIGTLEFGMDIPIPRERPADFFSQLHATNQWLFQMAQESKRLHFVQPIKYPFSKLPKVSFDAVHFTAFGHDAVFRGIREAVDIHLP